ncbi:MAG: UDP-N-acetylmuramoylalanyl-D-glutamyl-2, 6-diaminopimelate--D-alanyl-D-alanine ligase, partial [Methylocystis sp.]
AVQGDMQELGPRAGELHADLAQDLIDARVDLLFTSGPLMSRLSYAAPEEMRAAHRATPLELEEAVLSAVRPGDVVMVKGSNGSRMSRIVSALKTAFAHEMAN